MLLLVRNQQLIKNQPSKGDRRSTLYKAHAPCARITPYRGTNIIQPNQESLPTVVTSYGHVPLDSILPLPTVVTSYGHVPLDSILSNQCCMMSFDFQVFSTVSAAFYGLTVTQVYPPFPFSTNINWDATSTYIRNLSDKGTDFVYSLQINK